MRLNSRCNLRHLCGLLLVCFVAVFIFSSLTGEKITSREGTTPAKTVGDANTKTLNEDQLSYHPNLEIRGEWQQKQISAFCDDYGLENITGSLDIEQPLKNEFYRHMIVDDETKNLYCFMPKIGCTTARLVLLVAKEKLSRASLHLVRNKPMLEAKLEKGIQKSSFLSHSLSDRSRMDMIQSYGKYTIVRHPLQRILSAFIDKLSGPLQRTNKPFNYFEHLKHEILKEYSPNEYQDWSKSNETQLKVEFTVFIRWIIEQKLETLNEHFTLQYYNSQPCRVRYHFYGNFDHFEEDFIAILKQFDIHDTSYWQLLPLPSGHKRTYQILDSFWKTTSKELKHEVYNKYKMDFDFYHHLYPSEASITWKHLDLQL